MADASSSRTNWELIEQATSGDSKPAAAAVDRLVRRYWPAVFAYIRSTGKGVEAAGDFTQGFVCDVMLGRHLFEHADRDRGRFRTLLLAAVKNYLREQHRHDTRAKRAPEVPPLRLADCDLTEAETNATMSPEAAYCSQWNATLIRQVLARVRETCDSSGMENHWIVFEARVVRPVMFGEKPTPYAKLVDRLDLSDAGQAANMMITVKRRFVRTLLEEIRDTVSEPMLVEDELRDILHDTERLR